MKAILAATLSFLSVHAFAEHQSAYKESPMIYKCEFRIVQPGKSPFIMTGNIIPDDAKTAGTYLSLDPVEISGVPFEARILFTYWTDGPNGAYWYNPITIHRPGQTARWHQRKSTSGSQQSLPTLTIKEFSTA